jgi:Chromosome segregation ATPases
MIRPKLAISAVTPKTVIGLSVLLLILAAILGFLNSHKVKTLRTNVANANAARDAAEHRSAAKERNPVARETNVANANAARDSAEHRDASQERNPETRETTDAGGEAKIAEAESKAAKAEAELTQLQKDKTELQAKLEANQNEIGSLQKRIEEAEKTAKPAASPVAPGSSPELQAQLEDARHQLDSAEKEKAFLSEKLQAVQQRPTQPSEEKKRRETSLRRTGVRGTVLAVNQAYNFVVLNLGARQGVEPNSEMLVLREGTLIGKIRISSVEPATAIGDIITSSLARGVQVQTGDTVIYAGTSS